MSVRPISSADGSVYYVEDNTGTIKIGDDFAQFYSAALNNSNLSDIYDKASITYGVPKDLLLAVTKAESEFQPNATSKSGAMGLMQLMPQTASYFGVTDAYDPEQNVMAGAHYLSDLLTKYKGNVTYAIAAYNAGSNAVDKYDGVPPYEETKNYVDKILSYLINGVELPDGLSMTGTMNTEAALGTGESESPVISFFDSISRIFGYDEYLDFIRLFLEKITTNMQRNLTSDEEDVMSVTKETVKEAKESVQEKVSDSYIAYQNMSRGNINIFLKPIS